MANITKDLKIGQITTLNEAPVRNFKNRSTFMLEISVHLCFSEDFSDIEM